MKHSKFHNINRIDNDDLTNPMEGVSNMSDAMLVLAVGIMLALVINWKIDIGEAFNKSQDTTAVENQMQEFDIDNAKQNSNLSLEDIESKFKKSGTVYTDVETGKTYIVVED